MKKLFFCFLIFSSAVDAQEHLYDYTFFTNSNMSGNYFYSKTSFKSPSFIKSVNYKLPVSEKIFNTPGNSLQLEYINGKNGNWNTSIFAGDLRGLDHFKPVSFLAFRIYTIALVHQEELPTLNLIFNDSTISENVTFATNFVNVWTTIKVPVSSSYKQFKIPEDVIGVKFSQIGNDGKKHTIYIDDIEFLSSKSNASITAKPEIVTCEGYAKHVDISWKPFSDEGVKYVKIYRSEDRKTFLPVGIQSPLINRYADFTGITGRLYRYKISFLNRQYKETGFSNIVSAKTKAMTDDELLTMVQRACFRYYWEGNESVSGLAKEDIPGRTKGLLKL